MFEIRVICDPADADTIAKTLFGTFTIGQIRQQPTRDGKRLRLYITADHQLRDDAYTDAPPIAYELAYFMELASRLDKTGDHTPDVERELLLRKAVLLDRMAMEEAVVSSSLAAEMAAENAEVAAIALSIFDSSEEGLFWGGEYGPSDPLWARTSYRGYVRQEYAAWLHNRRS
ncbi:hypothetical protein [Streptomyces cinnamoneus]|uniref:Uncharacterized protein n=1 Tax=Streptomyces cinnamoneus TaxID=53446 RepID=A0A918TA15_STRCJ|nr:hypothetical protein [Streptomyces cinnamoneus]GHC33174.1 hypothetical protein GCM10010507_01950 [Streptomyces cinnamoneus]